MIFIEPNSDLAFFLIRLALGIVFLAHGPAKIRDPKGSAAMSGLSPYTMLAVGLMETLGAASMILGISTQIGGMLLSIVMIGAIYMKTQKWNKGFTGENGFELDFIVLASALAVVLGAPTTYSLF